MNCIATLKGHTQGIRQIIVLPNDFIASASYDKSIKIWNPKILDMQSSKFDKESLENLKESSCLIRTLSGSLSSVLSLKYIGDNILASGSSDYTIKLWNLKTGEVMKIL